MKHIIISAVLVLAASSTAHAQGAAADMALSISPSYMSITRIECSPATRGGWLSQALGGILGAGIGSQIGGGSGQAAAAAAGAVLGAQAGAAMGDSAQTTQTCRDVTERRLNGYTLRTSSGRDVFVPTSLVQSQIQEP